MENKKEKLQELRNLTNHTANLSECMSALKKADGDLENAKNILADSGYIDNSKFCFDVDVPDDALSKWAYILTKVNQYLKHEPEVYRKGDTLGMPGEDWDERNLSGDRSLFWAIFGWERIQ